ncbi:hypothetical protein GCM10010103_50690 [Streptomyces paradoxus]
MCGIGAAHRREAPGCSPVIGGFVLSFSGFAAAAGLRTLTLGHRVRVRRVRSHLAERPCGPLRRRRPRRYDALVATCGRLLRAVQLRSVAQRFEQGSRLGDGSLAYRRGHGLWGT